MMTDRRVKGAVEPLVGRREDDQAPGRQLAGGSASAISRASFWTCSRTSTYSTLSNRRWGSRSSRVPETTSQLPRELAGTDTLSQARRQGRVGLEAHPSRRRTAEKLGRRPESGANLQNLGAQVGSDDLQQVGLPLRCQGEQLELLILRTPGSAIPPSGRSPQARPTIIGRRIPCPAATECGRRPGSHLDRVRIPKTTPSRDAVASSSSVSSHFRWSPQRLPQTVKSALGAVSGTTTKSGGAMTRAAAAHHAHSDSGLPS